MTTVEIGQREAADASNRWVVVPKPRERARVRLICLHAAGSGASMYRRWAVALPESVELVAVQLPGREGRVREQPIEDYGAALDALTEGLAPYLDAPHALFGHSMGGWLAFGLAQAAATRGRRLPERLFVSGCRAPGRRTPPGLGDATDEELIEELINQGGTDPAVLAEPELLALILPTLRADYRVCDSAPEPTGAPLPCPVSVLSGEQDPDAPRDPSEWSRWSVQATVQRSFPGNHFFLVEESEALVLEAVRQDLEADARRIETGVGIEP